MDMCLTCKGPAAAHGSDSEWDTACIGFLKGRNGELLDLVNELYEVIHADALWPVTGRPLTVLTRASKTLGTGGESDGR